MTGLHVLGIDIGTSNTKGVVAEIRSAPAGREVVEVAVAVAPTSPTAPGLVDGVLQVVREVLGRTGVRPAAVGIASMAETGVPLGRDGRPLTDLLRWDGHRAADEAEALARRLGRTDLFRATGVRPSAKVPLATWAWLATREPDVAARMSAWAGAADLVALALTGELVTDHTLAGRTMAYRLPGRGEGLALTFDAALLSTVGLRPEQLPRVALPDAVGGHVRVGDRSGRAGARFWADAADAFVAAGVVPGTPVVVAGHDHAVGSWAAGIRSPGDRADSLGTAEAVLTVLADPPVAGPDPDAVAAAGMSWVRTVSGRHDAVVAGSSSAGAMVGWLLDRPGAPATVAELLADALADLVRDPGPTDVVVLPYLSGRQCPAPDPTARVTVGPPGAAGSQLTRAVLEGVCLQARWMLTAQAELAGGHAGVPATGRPLTVLGGPGVADPAWARIKRAVMAEPLRRVTAREPVATGAALLAATRAGLLGTDVGTVLSADRAMAGAAPCLPTTLEDGPAPDPYGPMYDRFVAAALGPVVGASAAGAESAGGRRATR